LTLETRKRHNLIEKCLANESRARRELYDYIAPMMLGVARRYSRNRGDADDIFQESMMNFFHRLHQLKDIERMEGWAKTIVVNEAIRFYRKNRNITYTENIEITHNQNISNENIFTRMETQHLLRVIQELPDKMRMVINLFAIEGYKHEEIAEMLNISVGTSKSNLFDARKQIRKKIEEEMKHAR
jgi:RNA polymerase sigma-70 factor (ECF subfamily)